MGRKQGEQPTFGKGSVRPELLIPASSSAFPAPALAEDTAQPHAHPRVEQGKRRVVAVLEIDKLACIGVCKTHTHTILIAPL